MSKQGERKDGGMRDKGKAEEVRKARVIPEAALRGSACRQPVSLPQTPISEPNGLRARDIHAQSGLPLAKRYA